MSDGWTLEKPGSGIVFECDRLRRDRHELIGELTVRCHLPGAKTVNGILSTSDFNFSSLRARQDRAKHLAERAKTNGQIDWYAFLEEFCQGVFERERQGTPSIDLRTIEKPSREELLLDGVPVPRRHPTILFGDGGSGKSLLALWWAGCLATRFNMRVGFFDWELSGEDHRERLEQLFSMMPRIEYCRCELPLHHDIDRIMRVTRDEKLDYAVFDSVAIACDGPPESAEIASKYFRALRALTIGTLHIAHVNKSETADKRPFGSAFWHNLARSTWFVESEDRDGDESQLRVALHNRKSNLGGLSKSVSYLIRFESPRVFVSRANIADSGQLAERLSVRQRMVFALKRGALTPDAIADEVGADLETVKRTVRRGKDRDFVLLDGGKIGLLVRTV